MLPPSSVAFRNIMRWMLSVFRRKAVLRTYFNTSLRTMPATALLLLIQLSSTILTYLLSRFALQGQMVENGAF